jgi:hypothetical protein
MRRDPNLPSLFHHIGEMRGYLRRNTSSTIWRRNSGL